MTDFNQKPSSVIKRTNIIYTNDLKNENIFLKKFISKNINNRSDIVEELSSSSCIKKLHKKADVYYKSLYCIDDEYKNYNDLSWIMPGKLIGYQKAKKKNYLNYKRCQIFTPARSGTVFLEKLLKHHYEKVLTHFSLNPKCDFAKDSEDVIFLSKNIKIDKTADIFFIYRTNLLSYFTSMAISLTAGYHHESAYDYSNVKILKKNYGKYIYQISKSLIGYFNTTCNMILSCPSTKFYLVNFENMVKNYSHIIKHTPVNYGKKKMELFEDYKIFEVKCLSAIETLEFYKKNWLDKLYQLQVPLMRKFDNFDKISK